MRIVQYIKRVNNTELGKGNTHDRYILVTENADVSELFPEEDTPMNFIFKQDNTEKYEIRLSNTSRGEKRILGVNQFYQKHPLNAGDEILLEVVKNAEEEKRYIDFKAHNNRIICKKEGKEDFSILTLNHETLINSNTKVYIGEGAKSLEIKHVKNVKKRANSPDVTKMYDILIGEESIKSKYAHNEMIQIDVYNNIATISLLNTWEKYIFEL